MEQPRFGAAVCDSIGEHNDEILGRTANADPALLAARNNAADIAAKGPGGHL